MIHKLLGNIKRGLLWIDENLRWVYLILVFLCMIAMFFMGLWIYSLSTKSHVLGIENKHRINDIQQERENNIRNACESTNSRHADATEALHLIYSNARKEAIRAGATREVTRLNASEAATISVIDALVPVLDCDEQVKKLTPYTGENAP